VRALLDAGANSNVRGRSAASPLQLAAYLGPTEAVELLLARGADPNLPDERGQTPLMLAAEHARHDVIRLLVDAGADLNAQDEDGRSVLAHADYWADYAGTADLLITLGANEE
jgi:ankyrin repeat protein